VLTAGVHRLRASGCRPGALDLFGVLTAAEPSGTIVVNATSLPIDLNRQNPTGSGCHQQAVALAAEWYSQLASPSPNAGHLATFVDEAVTGRLRA